MAPDKPVFDPDCSDEDWAVMLEEIAQGTHLPFNTQQDTRAILEELADDKKLQGEKGKEAPIIVYRDSYRTGSEIKPPNYFRETGGTPGGRAKGGSLKRERRYAVTPEPVRGERGYTEAWTRELELSLDEYNAQIFSYLKRRFRYHTRVCFVRLVPAVWGTLTTGDVQDYIRSHLVRMWNAQRERVTFQELGRREQSVDVTLNNTMCTRWGVRDCEYGYYCSYIHVGEPHSTQQYPGVRGRRPKKWVMPAANDD
jgi:hypothetical protein